MSRHAIRLIPLALLLAQTTWAEDSAAPAKTALSILKQIDQGFVEVFEKVAPAVVVIEALKREEEEDASELDRFEFFFRDSDSREEDKETGKTKPRPLRESRNEGSGFLIRPDGFILTNVHVVAEAEKIEVRLKDGRRFPAKVVGLDDKTDIAVIKVDGKDLPHAELGDSDALKVGQLVCAIGAPYNQDYSFTCGWVSGKGRSNLLGPSSKTILYEDYIQTDAFINPGNSGGPLFDVEGKVVGMNTLINGIGRGLAFAIPSALLADVSKQLMTEGKVRRSWIGVRVSTLANNHALRQHLAFSDGVIVDTIELNAPAYKSELRATDVITQVDGVPISLAKDLQQQIVRKKVGQVVQLTVWRGGRTITVPVTTGEVPSSFTTVAAAPVGKVLPPTAETLGMKLKSNEGRVSVVEIIPDGPAAKAGMRIDDVITDVESRAVGSPAAVFDAIGSSVNRSGRKGALLNIERKGQRTFVMLEWGG